MKQTQIWGKNVPYNSSKSKLPDMDIAEKRNKILTSIRFILALRGSKYRNNKKDYDTWTYQYPIKQGFEKETYEDVPYILEFLVKGSDRAVIVVPGGGFAYKQSDLDGEKCGEGIQCAKRLNKAGISAFVLWYRTNPYRMPVPIMDVKRAVRFVRFHAQEYGINQEKIGVIGFSGGGFLAAAVVTLLRNGLPKVDGYTPDEIDEVSDKIALAGSIYPLMNFKNNVNILHAVLNPASVQNEKDRIQFMNEYDPSAHIQAGDPPQFISIGTKDLLINPDGANDYIAGLKKNGVEYYHQLVKGANHGYSASKKYEYWQNEFNDWANQIFDRI